MTLGLEVVGFERITFGSPSSGLPSTIHGMNEGCVGIAQHNAGDPTWVIRWRTLQVQG